MIRHTDTQGESGQRGRSDAHRSDRNGHLLLVARAVCITGGCTALLMTSVRSPAPRLVWNATASAPIGLYVVRLGSAIDVGDMVIASPPVTIRTLAARRHYLPLGVPLVKRVGAGPGERVCALGRSILIDGRVVGERRATDARGRPMPWWFGCRSLEAHQYLLLMRDVPTSFDGRYFGISQATDIVGRARLIWRG